MAPLGKDTRNPNGGGIRAKSGRLYQIRPAEMNALVIGSRLSAVDPPDSRTKLIGTCLLRPSLASILGMKKLTICSQQ